MRFISDGPSLPDELLTARDADQVLFFCGAGVSQAQAGLPNFSALAKSVLTLLGSSQQSPARRVFNATDEFETASGLTGLVATDRIFGLLEREFEPAEVRAAVAIALKPARGYGLGAHHTLLDLSRNRAGVARLVTTNFDLLFEACEPGIVSTNPPRLPDPNRDVDFRGVVHLHGCVEADYGGARDDMFVLSSADFGHAYLSDGWATRYIQGLLQRFRIVFVGYSADDPPVQYLLEALNRYAKPNHTLYAFQEGDTAQAVAQWAHKGVEPIAYNSANGHEALWKTLAAWAERARDVDGWHSRLIEKAAGGPASLAPHERGMIAHLAATSTGAQRLAAAKSLLPAEWLFTFDRNARYAKPGKIDAGNGMSTHFDPFEAFGLDDDSPPSPTDPDHLYAKRPVPEDAWDAMTSMPSDRADLPQEATSQLRGGTTDGINQLPQRLGHLGTWLVNVAHQPAALWWASQQARLHQHVRQHIDWSMRHEATRYTPAVRDGWRMLLAAWQQPDFDRDMRRYDIEAKAKLEGWGHVLAREAAAMYRPVLTAHPARGITAPTLHEALVTKDIVRFDVDYPRPHKALDVPQDMLRYVVTLFREQLEHAVQLEREVTGHKGLFLDTTRPDDGNALDEDGHGLTGHLATFINMMARLVEFDREAARQEMARWSGMPDELFTRLRIWAAGRKDLTSADEASQTFLSLDDETFWGSRQERDLLYALRDRWSEMPSTTITALETRLIEGNFPWGREREDFDEVVAHYRLNRLQWLTTQGITFLFDYAAKTAAFRAQTPTWTDESSEQTAQPLGPKVFPIQNDTSATQLEGLPISQVLEKARNLGQRDFSSNIQRQPFHGLATARPARAISVLTDATRKGTFEPWAWAALLSSQSASLSPRMLSVIGHRLARLPVHQLAELGHPVSEWLRGRSKQLFNDCPHIFDLVWDAMIATLMTMPDVQRFPRADRGWVDEGLNRPAGRMADAMFDDPSKATIDESTGLPKTWKRRLEQLLGLPVDHRSHAIAMITPRLNWLFFKDPEWTDTHLLTLSNDLGNDGSAFWAGYLWRARTPQLPLYLRLKKEFMRLAWQAGQRREYTNILAGILLNGWGSDQNSVESEQAISDIEMREILIRAEDGLRTQVIWHLEQWLIAPDSQWPNRLAPFLTKVWPRQRAVRTASVSARLADLAFAVPERFPEIVELILPRLVPIKGAASLRIGPQLETEQSIAKQHPVALLNLLWSILADNPFDWPYQTPKMLEQLAEQPETKNDPRLAELRRRKP